MLIVTHDLPYAAQLCDRAVVMDGGVIVADGEISAILSDAELLAAHRLELPWGFVGQPALTSVPPGRRPGRLAAQRQQRVLDHLRQRGMDPVLTPGHVLAGQAEAHRLDQRLDQRRRLMAHDVCAENLPVSRSTMIFAMPVVSSIAQP